MNLNFRNDRIFTAKPLTRENLLIHCKKVGADTTFIEEDMKSSSTLSDGGKMCINCEVERKGENYCSHLHCVGCDGWDCHCVDCIIYENGKWEIIDILTVRMITDFYKVAYQHGRENKYGDEPPYNCKHDDLLEMYKQGYKAGKMSQKLPLKISNLLYPAYLMMKL